LRGRCAAASIRQVAAAAVAYVFTVSAGRIAAVELVADPARIQQLNIVIDE
jgi:hypothetical protein